ncbi:MAG: protein rep [Thermomicrobiales bacterium]
MWLCPVCAARIAERRRELLARAVESCRRDRGQVWLVSYTFRHRRADRLGAVLEGFLAAQRWMSGSRAYKRALTRYGVVGTVKALEVTWGRANGWHPHAHALLVGPAEVEPAAVEEELYRAWMPAAHRFGLMMTRERGVKVQSTYGAVADYVSKWGHEPARRFWGAEDELTKSHSKRAHRGDVAGSGYSPFDLLRWLRDTGESQPIALYRDYAATFKGRQQLTWSPGLSDLLGVGDEASKTDEQVAGEVREDAVLLATLTPAEWRAVRWCDQRGQLLEVARSGDAGDVRAFVGRLVAEIAGEASTAAAGGGVA